MARLLAAALLVAQPRLAAASCPEGATYSSEASPFGAPLTPVFAYGEEECWAAHYPFCKGVNQSPMDLALSSCAVEDAGGSLQQAAKYRSAYDVHGAPAVDVKVSKYLRTVMAEGDFGSLSLQDAEGHEVLYKATQVHLTAKSFHSVDGVSYGAEMLLLHEADKAKDPLAGKVIVSLLFQKGNSSSALFSQLGAAAGKGAAWSVPAFGIEETLKPALKGSFFQYEGSLPVPPCSETATWLVMEEVQSASEAQLTALAALLTEEAGGVAKRAVVAQKDASGHCRKVLKNGIKVAPSHEAATCAALGEHAPLRCKKEAACAASPVIEAAAATAGPAANVSELFRYAARPAWVLGAKAEGLEAKAKAGDFGYVLLNGRQFVAKSMLVKPLSQHVLNGKRYAAELLITHVPFGASAAHVVADAHHDAHAEKHEEAHGEKHDEGHGEKHDAGHGAKHDEGHGEKHDDHGHRRLSAGKEEVIVSVPLKLGKESPLLRRLGWGQPAMLRSVRSGKEPTVEQDVDLKAELAAPLAGNWYWYKSGDGSHDCAAHETRRLVFETPLEVSIEQINDVVPKTAAMDSTIFPAAAPTQLWKNAIPAHAVAAAHGACSGPWNHQNAHCWAANWSSCGGARQSPINVLSANVASTGTDNFLAKCSWVPVAGLDVENTGKGLQVVNNQLGYFAFIEADGSQQYYQVTGLKLHMPSEHMIDGKLFDAELQVAHQKQRAVNDLMEDDLAITSFFFKVDGTESPLLKQFHLPGHAVQPGAPTEMMKPLDLMRSLGHAMEGSYYRYDGSLTVPDCSEHTKWLLFETVMSMSKEQLDAFKALFPHGNNRPVQALNGRAVHRNSFQQGELAKHEFWLNRNEGRSRSDWGRSKTLILVPIVFTFFFTIFLMSALFQREDKVAVLESAGGLSTSALDQPIGKKQQYSRF